MYGGDYYGGGEEEEDDGDYQDDEDDEEEEEDEMNTAGGANFNSSNMSPDLLLALGLIDKIDTTAKSDWVPPSAAGLTNSDRILDTKNRGLNLDVKADNKTTGSILMDTIRAAAKTGGPLPLQDNLQLPLRAEAKEEGNQSLYMDQKEDWLEDEESEEEVLDPEFENFYDDIVQGKKDLKGDDTFWEMKSQLNASLGRLFGKNSQVDASTVNWERPKTYGLQNSEPIIKTTHNQYKEDERTMSRNFMPAEEKSRDGYSRSNNEGQSKVAESKAEVVPSYYRNEEEDQEQDEDEDDDDDEEEEEDYDYDDNNDNPTFSVTMSPNLMMALGLTVTNPQVSDWQPPTRSGLEYSDPLLRNEEMVKLSNGMVAKRKE